jgi:molybdopterin converting factor subunit 1
MISVLFFGQVLQVTGVSMKEFDYFGGMTCETLLTLIAKEYPKTTEILKSCMVAVNMEYQSNIELCDGDQVAIIPPVSGG